MKKLKIVALSLLILLATTVAVGSVVYAYIYRHRNIDGNTIIGTAEIVSITNSTKNEKILIGLDESYNVSVFATLNCNIDAVVRVKIAPKYYNSRNEAVVLPNIVDYQFDKSLGNWYADQMNMCFYLDVTVKNIENLNILNSINFNNQEDYQGYLVELIVEVEIIQAKAIDYDNHPWKNNAPTEWIEKVKKYK